LVISEIENYVIVMLDRLLKEKKMSQYFGFLAHFLQNQILLNHDFTQFGMTDRFNIDNLKLDQLFETLQSEDPDVQTALLDIMKEFHQVKLTLLFFASLLIVS